MAQQRATKKQSKTFMYYVGRRRPGAATTRPGAASCNCRLGSMLQQKLEIDALRKLLGAEFYEAASRAIGDPSYVRFFEFELKDSAPAKDAKGLRT